MENCCATESAWERNDHDARVLESRSLESGRIYSRNEAIVVSESLTRVDKDDLSFDEYEDRKNGLFRRIGQRYNGSGSVRGQHNDDVKSNVDDDSFIEGCRDDSTYDDGDAFINGANGNEDYHIKENFRKRIQYLETKKIDQESSARNTSLPSSSGSMNVKDLESSLWNQHPSINSDFDSSLANVQDDNDSSISKQLQSTVKLLLESLEEQGRLRTLLQYTSEPKILSQQLNALASNCIASACDGARDEYGSELENWISEKSQGSHASYSRFNNGDPRVNIAAAAIIKTKAIEVELKRSALQIIDLKSQLEHEINLREEAERAMEILKSDALSSDDVMAALKGKQRLYGSFNF